jgi:hypothetical protein
MPPTFQPAVVVAVDFGTAATGYCIAQPGSGRGSAPTSALVYSFRPGDRSSQTTEKNLTSILLDAASLRPVGVGREARRRFFEMDPDESKK